MDHALRIVKKLIPRRAFVALAPIYHYALALTGAIRYGFPSRRIFVISVTGTKGKTTTAELVNAMLEAAGRKTALSGTVRFKIDGDSRSNLLKMTTPGRFFLQRFLRDAVKAGCEYAVLEMSSESVLQYRQKFISFNALVFTNLAPEHIEAHGSYDNYIKAKLELAAAVARSHKKNRMIVSNLDDREGSRFFLPGPKHIPYRLANAEPYLINDEGILFTLDGVKILSRLRGAFNLYNILGAAACVREIGISPETIRRAVEAFEPVPGRMQFINGGQNYNVIVDYAHTPGSLEAVYAACGKSRKICVLGGTGGGRDKWKRPLLGEIAERYCGDIILTDEDPYDEDPDGIVAEVRSGIKAKDVTVLMDRRKAIAEGLSRAKPGDYVLITGKGTDPYIMGPDGTKTPWSDAAVAREEIAKLSVETVSGVKQLEERQSAGD